MYSCASKAVAMFLAVSLVFCVLAGCNAESSQPANQNSDTEISVVSTFGPNDGGFKAFSGLCAEFSQNTGVSVNNIANDSSEEWKQGVLSSFDDGSEPDVLFFFTGSDAEKLISDGKLVPFDEIRKDFPDYASNINLSVLDNLMAADGLCYAVPIKGYWERLFVNTDIFAELNLPLPQSYDDLLALAKPISDAGYVPVAASLTEVPHYLFEALLYNETGPSKHHDIPDDPANIPQAWIDALAEFKVMYDAGMFPEDLENLLHAEAMELFQSKKAAMFLDGDWIVAQIRDTENTGVIDFPSITDGARKNTDLISGFSMGFYITRKAWDDPDKRVAAANFVEFVTSNASILRLNVSGAAMPVSLSESDKNAASGDGVTPLRKSIDELNMKATAFVGAVADGFKPDARSWLFAQILPVAKGELEPKDVLSEFITLNNAS